MPTPLSQYIHQNTAQCPDVSGNIPVAGHWCSRSSRVATADTAAGSIFYPQRLRRLLLHARAKQVAAFPVGQCHQHRPTGNAGDGIGLPIAQPSPRLCNLRARRQLVVDRKTATRRGALAQALLATVAQPLLAAFHPVGVVEAARVNATVDGGVADSVRAAFMAQTVLDLLRRPVLLQKQAFNQGKPFRVIELALAAAMAVMILPRAR